MNDEINTNSNIANNDFSSEEFDLGYLFDLFLRRKFIISSITLLGLLLSFFYARSKIPIFEGGFQIVLESKSKNASLSNASPIASGIISSFMSSDFKSLPTEVSILKSSSVLKPVYKYVVENKYSGDFSKISYQAWVNSSLDIGLLPRTTVLEINYKDSDKSLIKPVLNQISEVYQEYSGRDRENRLKRNLMFLEEELQKMKLKWEESIFLYQEFALDNSLGNRDTLIVKSASSKSGDSTQKNITDDQTSDRYESLFDALINLENEYTVKSIYYKPNSKTLKDLKLKISKLEESLTKPKEILLKYRELQLNALRNERLLENLEDQFMVLQLDYKNKNDPWELISDTTIIDKPISPKIKQIVSFGLISSFIFSILISYLFDRFTGLIFTKEYFGNTFKFPYLFSLPANNTNQAWDESINLLLKFSSPKKSLKGLNIIFTGMENNLEESAFCEYLKKRFLDLEIIGSKDFSKVNKSYDTLIICSSGNTKKNRLIFINQQINLLSAKPLGWIYLDNYLKM